MSLKLARVGLVLSAAAFLGWLGWLGYLVKSDARPPVLSFPQLLAASATVVVTVAADGDGKLPRCVTVAEVLAGDGVAKGQAVDVANLPDAAGYVGPGDYLVPLAGATNPVSFSVALPGRAPGAELRRTPLKPQIYPWSEAVRRQWATYSGRS